MPQFPQTLTTARLVLTPIAVSDAAEQSAAVNNSLPELAPWMPWAQQPQDVAEAERNLVAGVAAAQNGLEGNWTVRDHQGAYLGRIGVHAVHWSVPKGEIGYWMDTRHAGHGYAREAAGALVDALLEAGFRRIEIRCDTENTRSMAIPRALGFTQDAVFRHDNVRADGSPGLRDTAIFSLVQ